ncbi:MAG: response regulator [Cyclobacteriaceae bacterium]
MRVLIVDDSEYMRSQISDALVDAGYEVVGEAVNGETGIDLALSLDPDIITLDNILPDMIGTDVLRVLKQKMQVRSKVIIVSGIGKESAINQGLALGACDYIVKPFTPQAIVESIDKAVSKVA